MQLPELKSQWHVPTLLVGFVIFFYWRILFTDRYMFPWDAADFFYPYMSFVHEELRHFRFPFWNPFVMSGYPIIGDMEAQIFYPINWLFLALSPTSPLSYKLVEAQIIAHFFLAGLFMYYLARDFVGDRVTALLCGVLFMSSGAMVAHTQHLASINSMAWYPLVFLLARRGLLQGRFLYTTFAGFVFGIQVLAGHWQHSVYLGLLLLLYFAYEACWGPLRSALWPRWIFMLFAIAAVGAALAMVQIIPTYQLGNLSVRSYLTYVDVTAGVNPRYLWTLFLPNFFGGLNGAPLGWPYDLSFYYVFLTVPGCLLAVLGFVETLRKRNVFWFGMVLLAVNLSFGHEGHLAELLYRIPILNLFRNPGTYFDLANFGLCLMVAVGSQSLLTKSLWGPLQKCIPIGLTILLLSAIAGGLVLQLGWRIHGWYHMLAVLALVALLWTAMLRGKLSPHISQWAMLGLVLFQLIHYSMNQKFNWSINNPRRYLSFEYALGDKETLKFLRSDPSDDFRVAAIAGSPWSSNGWNVWRIPSIYGWNPITLRRYEHYIRHFTQTSDYTLPYGGPDTNWNSSMLDLLGVKYVMLVAPAADQEPTLLKESKYELVHGKDGWWKIYRKKESVSRAWFYPKAYRVPHEEAALAVTASAWFDARRTLLFEEGDLSEVRPDLVEELPITNLSLDDANASTGRITVDPNCSESHPMFAEWGSRGSWLRYAVPGPEEPGRYLLLMQHTAAYRPTPLLQITVENGSYRQEFGPTHVPGTGGWNCRKERTADLGELELRPGVNQITITSLEESIINIYALRLVRLPQGTAPDVGPFSMNQFISSPNHISFTARVPQDGFLLLNEVYYPGWEATVDGKPTEILRADGIFRSLFLSSGDHLIEFNFWPQHFAWGVAISLLTLASFLALTVANWRSQDRSATRGDFPGRQTKHVG
jgi:hypothetical protein